MTPTFIYFILILLFIRVASEVNHLKMEIEALTSACKEKDQQLQEVQQSLSKFKRVSTSGYNENQLCCMWTVNFLLLLIE